MGSQDPEDRFAETVSLLREAGNGNSSALAQVVEKYEEKLLQRIRHLMGPGLRSFADSGDCLQDVFLIIVQTLGRYPIKTEEEFLRWATHIARNRLRDLARRQRLRRAEALTSGIFTAPRNGRERTAGPATRASRNDDLTTILETLGRLSENHRRVIEMRVLDQLSYSEIAEAMGQERPETVRVLFSRAMARLTRAISEGNSNPG